MQNRKILKQPGSDRKRSGTSAGGSLREWMMVLLLTGLSILFMIPIALVLMNSFKGKLYISDAPFAFPDEMTFTGLNNYAVGLEKTGFFEAFGNTLYITVFSVLIIVLFSAMTAWYITRVRSWFSRFFYYLLAFSMIVPFQMVMFTMSKLVSDLGLGTPTGLVAVYLGFGAGLSVFMCSGFVKGIPLEVEEAAMVDGCGPLRTFFFIILPIMKPTLITVAILNAMWIWNDFLLPSLVLPQELGTISMKIQSLRGSYGSIDMGAMMAMLVLAIVPIIVFYLACQKYIIKGVIAGAVKG